MKPLLLLALLLATTLSALAQTTQRQAQVWRCGPDGRELRDSPCPSGTAPPAAVGYDQPSAADTRAAQERQRAETRQAKAMAAARRASEAEARRQPGRAIALQAPPAVNLPASAPEPVRTAKAPKAHRPRRAASAAGR